MPKYIFQETDYKTFEKDYEDHVHEEDIGSTVKRVKYTTKLK